MHHPFSQAIRAFQTLLHPGILLPLLLLAYTILALVVSPQFISVDNIANLLLTAALLLPAVLGMQLLLITGEFDLSIGANAALAGVAAGLALHTSPSVTFGLAIALLSALLLAAANAFCVCKLRISALIVTLATMGIARSLALAIPEGRTVSDLPVGFAAVAQTKFFGVSAPLLYGTILLIVMDIVCRHHILLRSFYAVGSNRWAAMSAGIRTDLVRSVAFIACGLGAAMTGVLQTSRAMSASPLVFYDLPLDVIAACILGGGTLQGGRGTMLGAAAGLLVVVATRNFAMMCDISVYWRYAFVGTLLLLVAGAETIQSRHRFAKTNRRLR